MTDPISDFIIRLKNAAAVGKTSVSLPYSRLKEAAAEKLKARGFVEEVEKKNKKSRKTLEVTLAYRADGTPVITDVKRVSKPGRRLYSGAEALKPVRGGRGVLIVSTPAGVLTGEEAREKHVGGEVLFSMW
jgi:small subunit ribosomal protein S8